MCGGPYALIGTVSRADAAAMGAIVTFDDRTVPAGSPLCYSYWIKALDRPQNRSGAWPVPDPFTEKTVCQRLRDKTPPDPAIISGLFARDRAIRVEWVGPPVQDIRAYHVYRSAATGRSLHLGRRHDRRAAAAARKGSDRPLHGACIGQLRYHSAGDDRIHECRVLPRHHSVAQGDLLVQGRRHRPERQ